MSALHALIHPARTASNRKNAARSTGPKTEAGKARSRNNALKHGLTGAGIALPTEDAQAIAQRSEALHAQFLPQTPLGAFYVQQIAVAMVRTDRLQAYETATLANRVTQAADIYDRSRIARADDALARLRAGDVRAAHRDLMATPEGMTRLLVELAHLRGCLEMATMLWSIDYGDRLDACLGTAPDKLIPSRVTGLTAVIVGYAEDQFSPRDWATVRTEKITPEAYALRELVKLIDEEIAFLQSEIKMVDLRAIAAERARAADVALFDPSPAAQLARRYEAAARRDVDRSLRMLLEVEARVEARVETQGEADAGAEAEPEPEPEIESPPPAAKPDTAAVDPPESINQDAFDPHKATTGNDLYSLMASFGAPTDAAVISDPSGDDLATPQGRGEEGSHA